MIVRNFMIPARLWLAAGIVAAVNGESRSAMIRRALQAEVDAAPAEIRPILRAIPK